VRRERKRKTDSTADEARNAKEASDDQDNDAANDDGDGDESSTDSEEMRALLEAKRGLSPMCHAVNSINFRSYCS
jgi:hypothetical protein